MYSPLPAPEAVRDAGVDIEAVDAIQKHQLKGVLGPPQVLYYMLYYMIV